MNERMILGMITGVAVGIVIVAVLLKLTKSDGSMKCRYDERQTLVRGKGFKYAFFVLMIYNLLYGMADVAVISIFVDTYTAMFIGIAVSVSVYASYCIWNEGYYSLNENPRRVFAVFLILGVINLLLFIQGAASGKVIQDNMLTFRSANLICAVVLFLISAETMVKWKRNRREADEI